VSFDALSALERMLTDTNPGVRLAAMTSIATCPQGAPVLERHLEVEGHVELQLACLDVLGRVGGVMEEPRLVAWSKAPWSARGARDERAAGRAGAARLRVTCESACEAGCRFLGADQ